MDPRPLPDSRYRAKAIATKRLARLLGFLLLVVLAVLLLTRFLGITGFGGSTGKADGSLGLQDFPTIAQPVVIASGTLSREFHGCLKEYSGAPSADLGKERLCRC